MTATNVIDPSHPSQASDLAPEISALIEAALARAAGRATLCRAVPEAPLRVPHLTPSKKRSCVVSLRDLVFGGLYVGVLLASWVSLLMGLNKLEAAQRTTRACVTQIDEAAVSRPALDRRLCDRLSQQG